MNARTKESAELRKTEFLEMKVDGFLPRTEQLRRRLTVELRHVW